MSKRNLFEDDTTDAVDFTDPAELDTDSHETLENDDNVLMIGVVGDMVDGFDEDEARSFLESTFDEIETDYPDVENYAVVSKLVDSGIPRLAYEIADERGYETWGVAPVEVKEADWYDVDYHVISGSVSGDESEEFIDDIEVFVRVGGDDQAHNEQSMADAAGLEVYEYDFGPTTADTDSDPNVI